MTLENITKSIRILDLEGTKTVEIPVEYLVQLVNELQKQERLTNKFAMDAFNGHAMHADLLAQRLQPCAKKFDEVG